MRLLAWSLLVAPLAAGCTPIAAVLIGAELLDGRDGSEPWMDTGAYIQESNAEGRMRGQVGPVGGIDGELTRASVWSGPGYFDVDLHLTDGQWAMIGGGFDPSVLSEGEVVVLDPDQHWIIGCSGPGEYQADFDEPAEQVAVRKDTLVIDGVEVIQVTIEAEFSDGSSVSAEVVTPVAEGDAE